MLLWRLTARMPGTDERVECHLIRRDMEYRLSLRVGKTVIVQETHRTPTAAAERAEKLRRGALEGTLPLPPPSVETNGNHSEKTEQPG